MLLDLDNQEALRNYEKESQRVIYRQPFFLKQECVHFEIG